MSKSKSDDPMIAALLREREAYLRTGKTERAGQVDEQLALRGYVEEEPAKQPPEGRSATPPQQQTAEQQPGSRPGRKATQKAD